MLQVDIIVFVCCPYLYSLMSRSPISFFGRFPCLCSSCHCPQMLLLSLTSVAKCSLMLGSSQVAVLTSLSLAPWVAVLSHCLPWLSPDVAITDWQQLVTRHCNWIWQKLNIADTGHCFQPLNVQECWCTWMSLLQHRSLTPVASCCLQRLSPVASRQVPYLFVVTENAAIFGHWLLHLFGVPECCCLYFSPLSLVAVAISHLRLLHSVSSVSRITMPGSTYCHR